jgi:hypothetical protein
MKAVAGLVGIARAALGSLIRLIARVPAAITEVLTDIADAVDPPREWQPRLWDRDKDPRSDAEERHPEG